MGTEQIPAGAVGRASLAVAIADDEPEVLDFLERVLTFLGHQVTGRAMNGAMLLEHCRRRPPDLIITDVRMPVMDGLEAVAQIEREQRVPVILISASHVPATPPGEARRSIVARLQKPVKRRDIEAAVALAIRRLDEFQAPSESENLSLPLAGKTFSDGA